MKHQEKHQEDRGRIDRNAEGMGAPSPEMVEKRAREIAVTEGRLPDNVTESDRDRALAELKGQTVETSTDDVERSASLSRNPGDPTAFAGEEAPKTPAPDDQQISERETLEGVEEAEHERRVEAGRKSRAEDERGE